MWELKQELDKDYDTGDNKYISKLNNAEEILANYHIPIMFYMSKTKIKEETGRESVGFT